MTSTTPPPDLITAWLATLLTAATKTTYYRILRWLTRTGRPAFRRATRPGRQRAHHRWPSTYGPGDTNPHPTDIPRRHRHSHHLIERPQPGGGVLTRQALSGYYYPNGVGEAGPTPRRRTQ